MSAWKDFVTVALLGTEKGASAMPVASAALESALGSAGKLEREAQFLTRAGAIAWWCRAGWKPPQNVAPVPLAPPETGLLISQQSVSHLRFMLHGGCATLLPAWLPQAALPEWLNEAARLRRRLPPELLPALLERARRSSAIRSAVLAAGGERVRWLAEQNPEWNFASDDSPEHWETGSRDQRLAVLRRWRTSNPDEAREKLEVGWSTEPADARSAFLAVLMNNLSDADAPFLERTLDDRSKEVRRTAIDLLARLPNSLFAARMIARATPLLTFKRGGLLTHAALETQLPDDPDAAARRDGLDPKMLDAMKLGTRESLLALILSAVPLRHWTDLFQQSPEILLKAAERNDFAGGIITGWALAAIRQRDAAWAGALHHGLRLRPNARLLGGAEMEIFDLLPASECADRLLAAVRAEPLKAKSFDHGSWVALLGRFGSAQSYLPEPLAREVLGELRRMAVAEPDGLRPYHLQSLAGTLALRTPPALLPEAIEGWPLDKGNVPEMVASFAFRRDALAALAQP